MYTEGTFGTEGTTLIPPFYDVIQELHAVATAHEAVLVLHGASGIATDLVKVSFIPMFVCNLF